jgi:DNA/RNA-binding domain of Phe-tRNA-synthetase-like protein
MSELVFSVADEVFARFPGYARGVVLAYGVTNSESPPELAALLRAAEDSVRQRLSPEGVAAHPRIACWRGAYASFGAKPAKFRSSIEAMVRRALRDEELPSISALVDVGNVVSLRHMVPAGGQPPVRRSSPHSARMRWNTRKPERLFSPKAMSS